MLHGAFRSPGLPSKPKAALPEAPISKTSWVSRTDKKSAMGFKAEMLGSFPVRSATSKG